MLRGAVCVLNFILFAYGGGDNVMLWRLKWELLTDCSVKTNLFVEHMSHRKANHVAFITNEGLSTYFGKKKQQHRVYSTNVFIPSVNPKSPDDGAISTLLSTEEG